MLEEKGDVESRTRAENVRELKSSILSYMENTETPTLAGFLEEIALYTDIEQYDPDADAVVMMTMHAAKGLEFPNVFLVGLEEGLFPSNRCMSEPEELEEERRLCYVAITRAKQHLVITYARQRMLYGRTTTNLPSRFVDELPAESVKRIGAPKPSYQQTEPRQYGSFGRVSIYGDSYNDFSQIPTRPKPQKDYSVHTAPKPAPKVSFAAGEMVQHKAPAQAPIPLGAVVTASGTGAEMNGGAVITNEDGWLKKGVNYECSRPRFAIMNPALTCTLPPYQTASGGVDIMMHTMERYFSNTEHTELLDRMSEGLLKTVMANTKKALAEPNDYDARAELMWAGSLSHNNLMGVGKVQDWATHKIEHELGGMFDVAHGAGLAVVHPAYLEYICESAAPRLARFARNVWGIDPAGKSESEQAKEGIAALKKFFHEELGAPATLRALGVPESCFARVAELTDLSCYSYRQLTADDVIEILRRCY